MSPAVIALMCLLLQFSIIVFLLAKCIRIHRIKRTLELQLEQAKHMLQAQIDYYNRLWDNTKSICQIRHNMSNQLQSLSILLKKSNYDLALEQLTILQDRIRLTRNGYYTGNPVVDAVIFTKQSLCADAGIDLSCSGSIATDVGIRAVSLSGAVFNLLEHAIHACENVHIPKVPIIRFSVAMKNGSVVFCCSYPVSPTSAKKPNQQQKYSMELSILRSIAREYHGDFQLIQHDGTEQSILWLIPNSH